jgi:DNA-binding CsgD family transcriptional regulator
MINIEQLIGNVGEAIDRAAIDPTRWAGVLDAICSSLPGTKATIHVADTRDQSSIGVIQHGFGASLIAEYERHYSKLNPWGPFLMKCPALQAIISDDRLPASSFRQSEFYCDWLARVGDMDSTVGMKLVHEQDRIGVIAIHHHPSMAERYNPQIARVLQSSATRLRRAVDAARLACGREAAGPASVPLGAFALPAFLLDGRGRVLELNEPATRLIEAPGFAAGLSLGLDNTFRLGSATLAERVVAVARQIAAGRGPWSDGLDLPLTTADGRRLTVSLLAVREPTRRGAPAFFAASRLTLLLLRPCSGGDTAGQAALGTRYGLTPAERRLAVQLASGLSLRQSADRLGVSYQTARSQLKLVFAKTGTSRQAALVALLARLPPPGGEG